MTVTMTELAMSNITEALRGKGLGDDLAAIRAAIAGKPSRIGLPDLYASRAMSAILAQQNDLLNLTNVRMADIAMKSYQITAHMLMARKHKPNLED